VRGLLNPETFFQAVWGAWALYWWVASWGAKPTRRHESVASRLGHIVPLAVAVVLLAAPRLALPGLDARWLPRAALWFWIGATLTAAGLLYTVWARVHLGRNWSGTVTIKHDHQLVTSGPYALTRHPIYSGLLLAFLGSALARGEWRGVLALALVAAAFWRKVRHEERWLKEEFGDAYTRYRERVAALVPKRL
jgi:protein-S-isoprenylcysteine O-methyltransferase Ste14